MRKYFLLYGLLAVMLVAGVLLIAGIAGTSEAHGVDAVAVNRIVKQAAAHWDDPSLLGGEDFAYRFSVVDGEGTLLWRSSTDMPEDLQEAIRRGFLPMDIPTGGGVAGKALIETAPEGALEAARSSLARAAAVAFGLLILLNGLFLLLLHRLLVRPFRRLEAFAHKISTGRLDEPLPMDRGNLFGLFTQSFDLMRVSLMEERQNRLRAEQAKKELIASLSHDIRTPVTSIRAYAELLELTTDDSAAREKLAAIEQKTDQIARLMNNLLQSTLEELEELAVNPQPFECTELRGLFEAADFRGLVRVGAIPSCLLELDRSRMEQVIGNIITNSYKYANTRIDVTARICDELLQVDVADYGGGVEPEELDLLTTKFYRGEGAKATQKEGEGLGLYIAALLMEKGGGGLEALNREDGFTVRIWVPLA